MNKIVMIGHGLNYTFYIQPFVLTSISPMEQSATVQIPLPDWKELWLHTAVMLDMHCLVKQREHVNLTECGVEGVLLVKVNLVYNSRIIQTQDKLTLVIVQKDAVPCFCLCSPTAITCPPLPDHPYGSITYSPDNTPPYLFGTQAMYVTVCPEGLERRGEDDVRTCTGDGSGPVGQWNGTAPVCLSKIVCLKCYWYLICMVSHNLLFFSVCRSVYFPVTWE